MVSERIIIEPKIVDASQKISIAQTFKGILTSRSLLGVILSAVLMLLASLTTQGISNYLYADYFRNTNAMAVASVLALPSMFILAMVSTKLAMKFGKKECSVVGCAFAGVMYLLIGILHIENVWVYIILAFIASNGMYILMMQCYALVADVIDDKELRTGTRDDGTIYGVYSFSRKIGQAIAGGMVGWLLTMIGYDSLAVSQVDSVRSGIYSIATIAPGIIFVLCALVLAFIYPLGKKKVEENVAELKIRHAVK